MNCLTHSRLAEFCNRLVFCFMIKIGGGANTGVLRASMKGGMSLYFIVCVMYIESNSHCNQKGVKFKN